MNSKDKLYILEMMIDRLTRELYSNGSMMGAVNSAYEAMSDEEKTNYTIKRKQLSTLVAYKAELLNTALTEIGCDVVEGFDFSL